MQKSVLAVALAAFAVLAFPAAAQADGIAFAGVQHGRMGVQASDSLVHYVTLPLPKQTVVTRVNAQGSVLNFRYLEGAWGIPMVSFDGTTAGISGDGRTLVLAQPPIGRMRKVSKFPVLDAPTLRPQKTVVLRGSFSFDALSPDGRTLYLIEHVNRQDVAEYQVRAYDLDADRLLPYVIRDHRSNEAEMYGYPISRTTSADGRWAYTLYQGAHHSFVHALDTVARDAFCIDLPMGTPAELVGDSRLLLDPARATLTVSSRSGGTLALIDTEKLALRDEEPQAAATPRTPQEAPVAAIGVAIAFVLLVAAYLAVRRLRAVPAVVADQRRDEAGERHARPDLDEQPRLVAALNPGDESPDGDPDARGQGRQQEENHRWLVPWPPDAHPEGVVAEGERGRNGSREDARERLLGRGRSPRGHGHDRRRQPGREHQPV